MWGPTLNQVPAQTLVWIKKERVSSKESEVSPLCLIDLTTTSTCVWGHGPLPCLQGTPAGIPLGPGCGPSCVSVPRASCSACHVGRTQGQPTNERSDQISKHLWGTPRAGRSHLPHLWIPDLGYPRGAATRQTFLLTFKLVKVNEVTHSIPRHTSPMSGAQ